MNKQQLANKIWESANKMRSKIEANEYKDYILGFIFYERFWLSFDHHRQECCQVPEEQRRHHVLCAGAEGKHIQSDPYESCYARHQSSQYLHSLWRYIGAGLAYVR